MQSISLQQLEETLQNWDEPGAAESISLRLLSATNGLEDYLPHPYKEVRVFSRPKGLQLSSGEGALGTRHFALPYAAIEEVELLPSFIADGHDSESWKYLLVCGFLFYMTGALLGGQGAGVFWLPCGLVFGLLLSTQARNLVYRQKLRVKTMEGGVLYFSLAKGEVKKVSGFFAHYLTDLFKMG